MRRGVRTGRLLALTIIPMGGLAGGTVLAQSTVPGADGSPFVVSQLSVDALRPDAGQRFRAETTAEPGLPRATFRLLPLAGALSLGARYRINEQWGVAGQYLRSSGQLNPGFDGPPRITGGEGFSLGLERGENWLRGDRLTLTVSQPHRLSFGPVAPDSLADLPDYGQSNLRGQREFSTELRYFTPLWRGTGVGLSLINRARPNHDSSAADERIMMMRFSTQF